MKTITEIIAGAQGLLNISYNLQNVFIEAREKPQKQSRKTEKEEKKRRGRPPKGEICPPRSRKPPLRNKSTKAWKIRYTIVIRRAPAVVRKTVTALAGCGPVTN
jgi:hypothetical protein